MIKLIIILFLIYLLGLTSMAALVVINGVIHLVELFKDMEGDEYDENQ